MNGEQSGPEIRQTALQKLPALVLNVRRVVDGLPQQPTRAEFCFDAATPMIVSVTFTPWRASGVTWRIGRELLYHGLFEETGEGDVQVWPMHSDEGEAAWLLLQSEDASAVLELPVADVADWLDASYDIVAAEAETDALDWDAFIASANDWDRLHPGDVRCSATRGHPQRVGIQGDRAGGRSSAFRPVRPGGA